jgi:3-methyladenine DNA glycosylase/8-oxoguanine DNA glycosylase
VSRYSTGAGEHETGQPGVIEFVQENLSSIDYNIVCWAEEMLRAGDVRPVHELLISINGVGAKIASLFLRDVAWACEIRPTQSRELFQPVDMWVRRYVHHWEQNDELEDPACAHWIVERASEAAVSPERVNAGMWYFGARVAGDELTLTQLIDDAEAMRIAVEKHVNEMAAQVAAWRAENKEV